MTRREKSVKPLGYHILKNPDPPAGDFEFPERRSIYVAPHRAHISSVYVMRCEQFVKVGRSGHPSSRFSKTSYPFDITLEYAVDVPTGLCKAIEAHALSALSGHLHRGEWFTATVDEAKAAVNAAVLAHGVEIVIFRVIRKAKARPGQWKSP